MKNNLNNPISNGSVFYFSVLFWLIFTKYYPISVMIKKTKNEKIKNNY
jgi:hypothetical protein